jgi:hypothetical protein
MKVPLDLYEEHVEGQISAQLMPVMLGNSSRAINKVSVMGKQTIGLNFETFASV